MKPAVLKNLDMELVIVELQSGYLCKQQTMVVDILEDRRPSANMDPYKVCAMLIETTCK